VPFDDCPTSSSISCTRCSSIRTDLGYSSGKILSFKVISTYRILGQDDSCSFGPCECLLTTCDACLTERKILH
jgi:hypothetical protein